MRAVDTNVLVRLLLRDDAEQSRAAESFVSHGAFVPSLVFAEVIWVLQSVYERTPAQIASAVEMLLNHETLTLDHREAVANALTVFRDKPKLGFADCLLLELCRKAGHLPLGTFDRDLAKLPGAERIGRA